LTGAKVEKIFNRELLKRLQRVDRNVEDDCKRKTEERRR
jgi:hypothetical protein